MVCSVVGINLTKEGFLDERGRWPRLPRRFVSQLLRSELSQLVMDQRPKFSGRLPVAPLDRVQALRYVIHGGQYTQPPCATQIVLIAQQLGDAFAS
jgi:hypothetical protein